MNDMINPKDFVPFQVQHLIDSMLGIKDNVYVRGNLRTRLDIIRNEIDIAIKKYDREAFLTGQEQRKKGK